MERCRTSRSILASEARFAPAGAPPGVPVARLMRRRLAALLMPALALWWQPFVVEAATLNFRDVDIRQIIESVSELTGRNFLIDQRVKGKVTIVAASEVPDDAVYDILLTVLAMHGFRTVDAGNGLTRVVPANAAARFSPLDLPEGLTTEIIKISHLNAAGVVPMVRPLMTGEAQVTVHKETNSIIVTELQANLARIKGIIEMLDRKTLGEYEIIELKRTKAKDLVNLVQRARSQQTKHLVEVIADPRTNRVILVGAPELRLPLRALIAELDTLPDTEDAGRGIVRVLHLNYADAEEMKEILKGLLTKQFLDLAQEGAGVSGSDDQKKDEKKDEKEDEKKDDDKKDDDKKDDEDDDKRYTVQADPATNVLIVSGPSNIVQAIESVVKELDVPRPQVFIEAIIAEISLNKSADLQTRLAGGKDVRNNDGTRTFQSFPGGGAISSLEGLFTAFNFTGTLPVAESVISGKINNLTVGLFIQALRSDENTNILSTPSVMTLNNEQAKITIGTERTFNTGSILVEGGSSQSSLERRDVDTVLEVTPQITKGDVVRLEIKQSVNRVEAGTQAADQTPNTFKREIETDVVVNDKEIVILGGLIREQRADTKDRVPLLSDIPLIGWLFKGRESDRQKTNLMVFIRPTIFREPDAANKEAVNRYVQLRLDQLENLKSVDSLLAEEERTMLLPTLEKERQRKRDAKRNAKRNAKRDQRRKPLKKRAKRAKRKPQPRPSGNNPL